ncbi:MAG TPA: ABC transporter permease [Aggregatilineales bacterium]|nr:ABC transporter permease [Aggregatilineales bacterium]
MVTIESAPVRTSRLRSVARRLTRSPLTLIGTVIVAIFLITALVGPLIAPFPYDQTLIDARSQPPSLTHLFGTDNLGRDVFSRVVIGCRDILSLAGLGTVIALAIGTATGLVVAYQGGLFDEIVMRLLDAVLSLPAVLLALLLLGALGPSTQAVLAVIVVVYIPIVARVVRSVALETRTKSFVEAAKLRGEHYTYILAREILPSVFPALVVEGSFRFAYAIFLVATLGFLGVGPQAPAPDWGLMVFQAREQAAAAPWALFFPCAAIGVLVIGVNLMSDGLKEILQSGRE